MFSLPSSNASLRLLGQMVRFAGTTRAVQEGAGFSLSLGILVLTRNMLITEAVNETGWTGEKVF